MADQDNVFVDMEASTENLKKDGIEMKRHTYNPTYNVYAQDIDLKDEHDARVKEMETETTGNAGFQDAVVASLQKRSSNDDHNTLHRQASSGISSGHSNESDKLGSDKDTVSIEGAEAKQQRPRVYTEEEKIMLEKLRKVVELCTQPEPIKRPTSKEILEMLKI